MTLLPPPNPQQLRHPPSRAYPSLHSPPPDIPLHCTLTLHPRTSRQPTAEIAEPDAGLAHDVAFMAVIAGVLDARKDAGLKMYLDVVQVAVAELPVIVALDFGVVRVPAGFDAVVAGHFI
jgi:hypothetical protein